MSATTKPPTPARPNRTEISAFAHALSHDLRVPLSNILSAADFVAETVPAGSPVAADLALIKRNAARAIERMRRLVEYADASNPLPPAEALEIEDVVDDALAELEPLTRERGAIVRVRRPLPQCRAPRRAITVIIRAILENAILYHDAGVLPDVEVGALGAPACGVFVRDHGVGIPEDERERVFEPFVRLQRVAGVEGAGVGLATARRLARAIGSALRFAGREPAGVRIELTLPEA
ncbi:MAG: HAMP domain-containing histidine kinase [Planctomycetes bacterium]|nr:HAMP domain-containing histidine kinase [Planctomycetota bacterium]MBI3845480.1 HAMP domain-containing histidine kinase [Planctomycetota bacterium]